MFFNNNKKVFFCMFNKSLVTILWFQDKFTSVASFSTLNNLIYFH